MPRITITLSNERYQALKEAAAKRRKSLVTVIDESLDFYGIKSEQTAADLVAKARCNAGLGADDAMALAVEETRAERQGA
ncbi:MAG TPA: hypothetical protein VI457_09175 [Methylococcaceae bacterium]|nr:hypothetical protein [Methylococcaceae bacterium]